MPRHTTGSGGGGSYRRTARAGIRHGEMVSCKVEKKLRKDLYSVTIANCLRTSFLVTYSDQYFEIGQEISAKVALIYPDHLLLVDPADFGGRSQSSAEIISISAYLAGKDKRH